MGKIFRKIVFHFCTKRKIYCMLLIFSCLFSTSIVLAEESGGIEGSKNQPENDVGFAVEPILTKTQIDSKKGFYFIKVEPNKPQELTIKIRSTNVKPATVSIYVKDAHTNKNGAIDYDNEDYKKDATLKNSIEEITTISEKKVTVENYEEKKVTIKITPPKEQFTGVKGGAICIMKADTSKVKEGISSTFGYRIGLVVTEDSEVYDDGSTLKFLNVQPTVSQGRRVIQARMQNPEPKILKDLMIETKLTEKGGREVLKKRKMNNMRMAPNSQFEFSTNWGIDPLKSGTYTLFIKAKSGTSTWKWKQDFTVGEKEARKINEDANFTITYQSWVPLVTILISLVNVILIGCLYVRSKKWRAI